MDAAKYEKLVGKRARQIASANRLIDKIEAAPNHPLVEQWKTKYAEHKFAIDRLNLEIAQAQAAQMQKEVKKGGVDIQVPLAKFGAKGQPIKME